MTRAQLDLNAGSLGPEADAEPLRYDALRRVAKASDASAADPEPDPMPADVAALPMRERARWMLEQQLPTLGQIASDRSANTSDRIAAIREMSKLADAYAGAQASVVIRLDVLADRLRAAFGGRGAIGPAQGLPSALAAPVEGAGGNSSEGRIVIHAASDGGIEK